MKMRKTTNNKLTVKAPVALGLFFHKKQKTVVEPAGRFVNLVAL